MSTPLRLLLVLLLAIVVASPACAPDAAPDGVKRATKTGGPKIRFDLSKKPLPDLPLPNDVGTWPDPTSRTGKRIDVSVLAPTAIERSVRAQLGNLEGWGTFAPLTIPFDRPLDTADVAKRMKDDDFDFRDDPVYLVNLTTGVPVPLDLGQDFPVTLRDTARYWPNDPLANEANLVFDTHEEDLNGNGRLDPGEDTDFDGVLDHPNFPDGKRPDNGVDGLLGFYESETSTLILRPLIPLDEKTEYAVVVTDRLHGADAKKLPVESPFDFIHHPSQRASTERLVSVLDRRVAAYGWASADEVMQHVQFVYTFTTEPTTTDLFALRDGVYGRGPYAWLASEYAPQLHVFEAVGDHDPADPDRADMFTCGSPTCLACAEQGGATRFVGKFVPSMKQSLNDVVARVFGLSSPQGKRLIDGYDDVAYVAIGEMKVPWLLGDVRDVSPWAAIDLDPSTGAIPHTTDTVQFIVVVPKATEKHKPPFPVAIYGHGYTGAAVEGLGFAGELARHGVATVAMNAPGHGLELSTGEKSLAESIFRGGCLTPFAQAFEASRVRDLNGDGEIKGESGGDFFSAYVFHTRDMVRQAIVERVMMIKALRAFDGSNRYDWKGNGSPSLAGDFDEDGVVDLGGPTSSYYAWGESLGGILSGVLGGVDPYVTAAAPVSGGGSLTDIGIRSFQGGVVEAVQMRLMTPLIISVPAEARIDWQLDDKGQPRVGDDGKRIAKPKDRQTRTICDAGQRSLRFFVVDLNKEREIEIACANADEIADGMDVVVYDNSNGETRCAKVTPVNSDFPGTAQFRVGIPASVGDKLYLAAYAPPNGAIQAVRAYGSDCTPLPDAKLKKEILSFQGIGDEFCPDDPSKRCIDYESKRYAIGSRFVSVADGYGLKRQTPDLRRLAMLAQIALEPADPITFAPYYYTKPKIDPFGNAAPPTAILTIDTIGDQNVPISTGIAQARVHGAIPFLRPENPVAHDYPDYVAPKKLIDLFGGKTPNQVLVDAHVLEGIARLKRHPAAASCAPNVNASMPGCPTETKFPDRTVCDASLLDPENLSEGAISFHPQILAQPLRLARIAKHATEADLAPTWAPRLSLPWTPSAPLGATIQPFIVPEGVHGFLPPDPCLAWDDGAYLSNILAHFFRSDGKDLYYLSHPTIDPTKPAPDHRCAAITDPSKGCDWGD